MDFKIIEDDTLVDRIEHRANLTWRERLFSWPWRPWVKTRSWFTTVPSRQMLKVGDAVHMHPLAAAELRAVRERQRRQQNLEAKLQAWTSAPHVKRVQPVDTTRTTQPPTGFELRPYQRDMLARLSQPYEPQPHTSLAETGRQAVDSMIDAFEPKRTDYGFPTFDRREPDPPGETGWSGGGDSSSSDSGSD